MWSPRPQLFSFLFLALLDFWLYRYSRGEDSRLWILLPFFALWANMHGGFIWGILLLLAEVVGAGLDSLFGIPDALLPRRLRKLALFSLLAAGAVLLNPNGVALWKLPFHTVDVSMKHIQEWASPNFHQAMLHPFLWMIFLLLFALNLSRKPLSFADLLKLTGFAYMAFVSQRNLAPFAIVAAPIAAQALSDGWDSWKDSPLGDFFRRMQQDSTGKDLPPRAASLLNGILILILLGAASGRLFLLSRPARVVSDYPAEAAAWLNQTRPQGRLFNSYNWGGYLLWSLPEYPVFIDGRADLYGNDIIAAWWTIEEGKPEAWELLDRWDVRLILLEPNAPILAALPSHGWVLLYEDEKSVIYGR